jgi:hypothetical protein
VDIYNDNSVKPGCKEEKNEVKAVNDTDEGPPKVSGALPP